MKLLIQIPCFNEEQNLLLVLESLPKKLEGVDSISIQLVDDASTDQSRNIAFNFGVDYILQSEVPNNKNLCLVFQRGQKNALENNFDILVNIDADNQYPSSYIQALIDPILNSKADIVIGNRNPSMIPYFSRTKKIFQRISNYVMSIFCMRAIPDAVSGFRAFNKKALKTLVLSEKYTYTIESLMQAYAKNLKVDWIDIVVNPPLRESKLITNLYTKLRKSGFAAIKFFIIYNPLKWFFVILFILYVLFINNQT
jgi:glycosyltransferase involved in cell wall biosynthesis